MTILRTGSNEKYSQGWEKVFGTGKLSAKKTSTGKKPKPAKKKSKKKK